MPSAEGIVARAIAEAGSSQFGPAPFGLGLQRTLEAFARLPLRPEVRDSLHERLVQDLVNRLKIEQWCADHPEIEKQKIDGGIAGARSWLAISARLGGQQPGAAATPGR
jgi:hypothetical protein